MFQITRIPIEQNIKRIIFTKELLTENRTRDFSQIVIYVYFEL